MAAPRLAAMFLSSQAQKLHNDLHDNPSDFDVSTGFQCHSQELKTTKS